MRRYKELHTFEQRKMSSRQITSKFPDRIPIIVEKSLHGGVLPELDKNKYLAPHDMTVGQFMNVIKRRIKLNPTDALFLFVNDNVLPPTSSPLNILYKEHKDEDGFLYMIISSEATFGCADILHNN